MSSTVVPGLRYRDAPKAIEWLCDAFGFEAGLVVEPEPGMIAHAQLVHGTGMVMLGSALEDESAHQVATVRATGKPTAAIYVFVEDVEGHAEEARAAGAEITIEPTKQDYGGSNDTCPRLRGQPVELRELQPLDGLITPMWCCHRSWICSPGRAIQRSGSSSDPLR